MTVETAKSSVKRELFCFCAIVFEHCPRVPIHKPYHNHKNLYLLKHSTTCTMAGRTENAKPCRFYDRIFSLHRLKSDGEWISKAGEIASEGAITLRIHKGERGSFLDANLGSLKVFNCNIRGPLKVIKERTVMLSPFDYSNGDPYFKRTFRIVFFDERSRNDFVSIYNRAIYEYEMEKTKEDHTMKRKEEKKMTIVNKEESSEEESEVGFILHDRSNCATDEEHNSGEENTEDDEHLFDAFEDFGCSQNMYEPECHFKYEFGNRR